MKHGIYNKLKTRYFTIVELIVAMAIFAILMLILMQIFSATQDVWRKTSEKSDSYESARSVLNIIAGDLQSAIYAENGVPFYCKTGSNTSLKWPDDSTLTITPCEELWFPTTKSYLIGNATQNIIEAYYKLTIDNNNYGLYKLEFTATTDEDGSKFDYKTSNTAYNTITTESSRKDLLLLENIVALQVSCLNKNYNMYSASGKFDNFPYAIELKLFIIDDTETAKQKYNANKSSGDAEKMGIKAFSRTVFIDRNQEI